MSRLLELPDLGEGVAEAEIVRWLVDEGQRVEEDAPLVEVETDKATVEIPSPVAGTVLRIFAPADEVVAVGSPLVLIGDDGAEPVGAPRRDGRRRASPAVRRLAVTLGVSLDEVPGTGPGSLVTESDVRRAANGDGRRATSRRPLRGTRRAIADRMARAHSEVAAVTVVEECDFTALEAGFGGYARTAFIVRAAAAELERFPELNASLDDSDLLLHERRDVGIAVQTRRGLVVPVLRDAGEGSFADAVREVRRLTRGARDDTLEARELRDSTFTVTDAGRLGGLFATPIVNFPEVAILGVHRVAPRPAVVDGEVAVRRMGLLSCTFDHRAMDGVSPAAFLLAIRARIEAVTSPEGGPDYR